MQEGQAIETEIREREKQLSPVEEREAELRDFLENAVVPIHWVSGNGTIVEQSAGLGGKDDIEAKIKKTIAATGAM